MFVLQEYAFGPIQEALDKRRATVNGAIEHAEQVKRRGRGAARRLQGSSSPRRAPRPTRCVDRARKDADEHVARVQGRGRGAAPGAARADAEQIRAEVDKAMGDLRTAVAEMTVAASEKVLRGSLDAKQHQTLIEQAVEELDFDRLQKVGAGS